MYKVAYLACTLLLISGCAHQKSHKALSEPTLAVENALLEAKVNNEQRLAAQVQPERFDVAAYNSDARSFLQQLAKQGKANLVIDDSINGKISINLNKVTFEQALNAIRDQYGYHFERTSYGYQIFGLGVQTRIFKVDYPNLQRYGDTGTKVQGHGLETNGSPTDKNDSRFASSITTLYQSDFWQELETSLQSMVNDGQKGNRLVINRQSGLVIVTSDAKTMSNVQRFLASSQDHMLRQVVIEAKILEVRLNERFSSGINWQALANESFSATAVGTGSTNTTPGANFSGAQVPKYPGLDGVFGISLSVGNPLAVIELLGGQGEVNVLSSPRISTINNQKAVIKVGSDDYYVSGINREKNDAGEVTDISVDFESIFSGISLDVTPKINDANELILHVRPAITEVSEVEKVITYANLDFSLPMASSRE